MRLIIDFQFHYHFPFPFLFILVGDVIFFVICCHIQLFVSYLILFIYLCTFWGIYTPVAVRYAKSCEPINVTCTLYIVGFLEVLLP